MVRRRADHGDLGARREAEEEVEEEVEAAAGARKGRRSGSSPRREARRSPQGQGAEEGRQVGRGLTPFADAARLLHEVHARTDKILVALSGGKDSLATLDLCVAEFGADNVSCFFMYLVKGLRCVEQNIRWAERRYKVKVHHLPHWQLALAYKYATYMPHRPRAEGWRDMRLVDIEQAARAKSGAEWVAYGHRMCDSIERIGMLKRNHGLDDKGRRVYPLWRWNEAGVVSYLRRRRIPLPPRLTILKRAMTGVSFHEDVLLAIRERYPDDFAKIVEVFPYLPARLARFELQKTSWKQDTYVDKWRTSLKGR